MYDELVEKFNIIQTIDTSDFVKKAVYMRKILDIEKKNSIMINILLLINLIS